MIIVTIQDRPSIDRKQYQVFSERAKAIEWTLDYLCNHDPRQGNHWYEAPSRKELEDQMVEWGLEIEFDEVRWPESGPAAYYCDNHGACIVPANDGEKEEIILASTEPEFKINELADDPAAWPADEKEIAQQAAGYLANKGAEQVAIDGDVADILKLWCD